MSETRVPSPVHIGTSGWSYARWRGDFFPDGLPQRDELGYLASRMSSLEVNATFYRLQRPESFRRWAAGLPDGFRLAVKGSRYITHMLRLDGVDQALANFWASGPLELAGHLGPVLWQLPPTMEFDRARMASFLDLLPRSTREAAKAAGDHDERVALPSVSAYVDQPISYAVEPRHPSFGAPAARDLLRERGVAVVFADGAGLPTLDVDTASLRYVRLHGRPVLYRSGYGPQVLQGWAARIRTWLAAHQEVFVYFDNDGNGRAPHDAQQLLGLLSGGDD